LVGWFDDALVQEGMVGEEDLRLYNLVDTPEEAVKVIDDFYSRYLLAPNF
jgi:hypothetical protein